MDSMSSITNWCFSSARLWCRYVCINVYVCVNFVNGQSFLYARERTWRDPYPMLTLIAVLTPERLARTMVGRTTLVDLVKGTRDFLTYWM